MIDEGFDNPSASPESALATRPEGDKSEYIDLYSGKYGFHYGIDDSLKSILEHGILSRYGEQRKGLEIRPKAFSGSDFDLVHFTARPSFVYKRLATSNNIVGFVIDKPSYVRPETDHFTVSEAVPPEDLRALVFVDKTSQPIPRGKSRGEHDRVTYKGTDYLPEEEIKDRLDKVRQVVADSGKSIHIYGVSGDMYWPNRVTHDTIVDKSK